MPSLHLAPEIWDLIYPIGSEYKTFDSTFNPNTKFNGSWTKYYEGKDMSQIAYRPRNSKLSKQKLVDNGFNMLPDWHDAVDRYNKELKKEKVLKK